MNEELMTNDEIEVVGEPEEVMDERSVCQQDWLCLSEVE